MLRKLLSAIGIRDSAPLASHITDGPYKDESANFMYQLLFCDRLDLLRISHKNDSSEPWGHLLKDMPNMEVVTNIANDFTQESRARMLAYGMLRAANKDIPQKELLGTIIEVRLANGLDTLAVFTDGGIRYINYTGKMTVVEGGPNPFKKELEEVIRASQTIINEIGPWDNGRLLPPGKDKIRMTFLVSDGLYFGEGTMKMMEQERMAAPLIHAATTLLKKIVKYFDEPVKG